MFNQLGGQIDLTREIDPQMLSHHANHPVNLNDRIYYDISIRYDDINAVNGNMFVTYREERHVPILMKANDYYLCVTRFSLPGRSIPIFIMDVEENPGDPTDINYSIFTVTLVYNELVGPNIVQHPFQVHILYVPHNDLNDPPATYQRTPYYFVNSYDHMIEMINTALLTSYNALKFAHAGTSVTETPWLIFNPETQLINLIAQTAYATAVTGILNGETVVLNEVEIFTNSALHNKFLSGFEITFFGNNLPNGMDYRYEVYIKPGNQNAYNPPGGTMPPWPANPPLYLQTKQEYNTLDLWNDFIDLLFLTSSIPIVKQGTQSNGLTDGQVKFKSVLTNFEPSIVSAGAVKSVMSYFQNGPYRVINLVSPQPMRSFDLTIQWRDKLGNTYPLFINQGEEVNVLFIFIRKDTFTS